MRRSTLKLAARLMRQANPAQVSFGRAPGSQRSEVVAHGFGAEILPGGKPGQTTGVFQIPAMLDALESFLDSPALMVKLGKGFGRKVLRVTTGRSHRTRTGPAA